MRNRDQLPTPCPSGTDTGHESRVAAYIRLHENLAGLTAHYADGRIRDTYFYVNGQVDSERVADPDGSKFCLNYYYDGPLMSQSVHNPDGDFVWIYYRLNGQPEYEQIHTDGRSSVSYFDTAGKLEKRMFGSNLAERDLQTPSKQELERFQEVKDLALESIGRLALESLETTFVNLKTG